MKLDANKIPILRHIPHPWFKVGFTLGYLLLILVMYRLGIPCLFRMFLNIPCPGCGMTRALLALLKLDLADAFSHHPMIFAMPVIYLYFLFDGTLFRKKGVDTAIWVLFGLGFLLHWLFQILG